MRLQGRAQKGNEPLISDIYIPAINKLRFLELARRCELGGLQTQNG